MGNKSRLLATLSALAITSASVVGANGLALSAAQAQEAGLAGLVTQLWNACLVENPDGTYRVVDTPGFIQRCCEVIRDAGPENYDFVEAVATGNAADPRLLTLRSEIVTVLLTYCQDVALQKVSEIALGTVPAAGPGGLYPG